MRLIEMATNTVVFAVHPNYVVDAAWGASSKYGEDPEKHGPNRMKILKNYIERFKRYINGKVNSGATIVFTLMGEPYSLNVWHDEEHHWEKPDPIKIGMEQEEVYQLHQDLMDFMHEMAHNPNVHIVPEKKAGEACRRGALDHVLDRADDLEIVGGHLSGCLNATMKSIAKRPGGPSIRLVRELSFDDDPEFWERSAKS